MDDLIGPVRTGRLESARPLGDAINDRKRTSLSVPIEIDEYIRVEYWTDIRGQPARVAERTT